MFTRDCATKRSGEIHNLFNYLFCFMQHDRVMRMYWNIGMDIAITCMHMRCNKYSLFAEFSMNFFNFIPNLLESVTNKNLMDWFNEFFFIGDDGFMGLKRSKNLWIFEIF